MIELAIATHDLTRRFGRVTAADRVSLQVPRGTVYGFLGPNGAGKTTTIRLLLGLLHADAGRVEILGQDLRRFRLPLLRRVGALVETPSLYPHLTGRENLEVVRRLSGGDPQQIARALSIVTLEGAADRLVGHYSLGMKQRLGLAMALLNAPDLLILDEPTNGLDPAGIREMRNLICQLAQEDGLTIFLSSHLLAEVEQMATYIGIINEGRLLFQGKLDELHAQMDRHVVVEVDQPQKAKLVLQQSGWAIHRNGDHRLTIAANDRCDVSMINARLLEAGINVYRLDLEQPTLEDIFMTMTEQTRGERK